MSSEKIRVRMRNLHAIVHGPSGISSTSEDSITSTSGSLPNRRALLGRDEPDAPRVPSASDCGDFGRCELENPDWVSNSGVSRFRFTALDRRGGDRMASNEYFKISDLGYGQNGGT